MRLACPEIRGVKPDAPCSKRSDCVCVLQERDGYPADPNSLFMTDGASPGVHRIIELLTRSPDDAFLTPIPQYPLYSAALALHGAHLAPYYLDEDTNWGLDVGHLRKQLQAVRQRLPGHEHHLFSCCFGHINQAQPMLLHAATQLQHAHVTRHHGSIRCLERCG